AHSAGTRPGLRPTDRAPAATADHPGQTAEGPCGIASHDLLPARRGLTLQCKVYWRMRARQPRFGRDSERRTAMRRFRTIERRPAKLQLRLAIECEHGFRRNPATLVPVRPAFRLDLGQERCVFELGLVGQD